MPLRLVLAAASASLILALPAAPASPSQGSAAGSAKGGKHKPKKCKKQKVPVTINGRRRCLPLKAALPAPREADQRLLAVQSALRLDLSRIHDRRGRRPPSAPKLLGAKGVKKLEKAVGQGLAAADQMGARASLSGSPRSRLATASAAGCGGSSGPPEQSQSFQGSGFQATVDVASGAAQIGVDLGEPGFRAELDLGLCELTGKDKLKIPQCPDANGELKGTDESLVYMRLKIFKGSTLLLKQSFNFKGETKIEPVQVDQDAKLEYFDIVHKYRSTVELGGTSQTFSNLSLSFTYTGEAHVTYPGANYDPTHTSVDVDFNVEGVDDSHELREVEFDQGLKAKRKADEIFADEVEKVIRRLGDREEYWLKPNNCAEIKFDPASETLTLTRDQAGQLQPQVNAKGEGPPAGAKWTLLAHENADVSPDYALANPASFGYKVTNAGPGIDVSATFKAVSQAGVAEKTWKQKTVGSINHLIGTFKTTHNIAGSIFIFSGEATFDRYTPAVLGGPNGGFKLKEGKLKVVATGREWSGSADCQQEGSKEFTISPGSSEAVIFGTPPDLKAPYTYGITIGLGYLTSLDIVWVICKDPKVNGTVLPTQVGGVIFDMPPGEHQSPDGTYFAGSYDEEQAGVKTEWEWYFEGTP